MGVENLTSPYNLRGQK